MPFDLNQQTAVSETARQKRHRWLVALWLFGICLMLLVMIGLGGATRLTGSGLSIMEWAPILGTLPPLSDAEWQRLFSLYRAIPQYAFLHEGFGLEGFKQIFWLEYTHRLWGRLIALSFAVPLAILAARGAIGRRLWLRLGGLLALGALQGGVGWFMVASGFTGDSVSVSAYRLVAHLVLAVLLYTAILATALDVLWPDTISRGAAPGRARGGSTYRSWITLCCCLIGLTIVAGGFVAGLHAGLIYNTFPLMGGQLAPPDYAALLPLARNITENAAAVQFDHRLLATATALLVTGTAIAGLLGRRPWPVRQAALWLGGAVVVQYALGLATLLWRVPVPLATAHQVTAILLLSAAVTARHVSRVLA